MTEFTSTQVAKIASRGLREPTSLTIAEIRAVCASALTQARPSLGQWLKARIMGDTPRP